MGAAIKPGLGLLVALAIVIDNLTEALSIAELIRDRQDDKQGRPAVWRIVKWTGLIGLSLFSSALAGWFFLRGLSLSVLGFLFAVGGGGMLYLTVRIFSRRLRNVTISSQQRWRSQPAS